MLLRVFFRSCTPRIFLIRTILLLFNNAILLRCCCNYYACSHTGRNLQALSTVHNESLQVHLSNDLKEHSEFIGTKRNMSWQAYVDTQLVATGHVQDACMLGAADGSVWGMTSEFQPRYYEADTSDDQGNPIKITVNEVTDLTTCFAGGFASAPPTGLRINGQKYMWLGTGDENGTKYVKAQKGQTSLCMAASGSCIVIATADKSKGQVFTSTISAVVALVSYLAQSGY